MVNAAPPWGNAWSAVVELKLNALESELHIGSADGAVLALGQQPHLCPLRVKTTDLQAAREFVHGRLTRLDKICTWGGLSRHLPRFNLARRLSCFAHGIRVMSPSSLFIYYKVESAQAESLRPRIRAMQDGLRQRHPELNAQLFVRVDAHPHQTWMEVYQHASGVAPLFRRILSARASHAGRILRAVGAAPYRGICPMCLVAVAPDQSSRFPPLWSRPIATSFDRPAAV